MGDLIVVGGGEHARVVIDVAQAQGWRVLGYLDHQAQPETTQRTGVPWLGPDAALPAHFRDDARVQFTCGIGGQPAVRRRVVATLNLPVERWAIIIHPSAVVSPQATLALGCQVLARAVVQTGAVLGAHTVVNSSAIVEHDVHVGDFAHLAPGAVTGGGVTIGEGVLIGLGARVRDHLQVGARAVVGVGAVVITDVPADTTVAGVPAVAIRATTTRDISNMLVRPTTSLYDAMAAIAKSGITIVLVTDAQGKLLGTLTDGDIRRALLAGRTMQDPVGEFMNPRFIAVREGLPRASALTLMGAHQISHLPVLDAAGRVLHLHTLTGLVGSGDAPLTAVIMAGGLGQRLRPLTETVPKPMLRVAGRPILEHLILHLVSSQVREIYLAINYLGEQIEAHFGDGAAWGCRLHYLREETALGTAGALSLLPHPWPSQQPLLVLNGDLVTQANLQHLLATHTDDDNVLTVGVRDYEVEVPFGVLEVDGRQVRGVREKPSYTYLTNAGIYLLAPSALALVPRGQPSSMVDLINAGLAAGQRVGIHLVDGDWLDVGRREQLQQARTGQRG